MGTLAIVLISGLVGMLLGVILAIKLNLGVDNLFKGRVRIKQRGRHNTQAPTIKAEIKPKTKRGDKKQPKVRRRNRKKL